MNHTQQAGFIVDLPAFPRLKSSSDMFQAWSPHDHPQLAFITNQYSSHSFSLAPTACLVMLIRNVTYSRSTRSLLQIYVPQVQPLRIHLRFTVAQDSVQWSSVTSADYKKTSWRRNSPETTHYCLSTKYLFLHNLCLSCSF